MHRVKAWAHNTAREHNYNPWSGDNAAQSTDISGQQNATQDQPTIGEPEKDKPNESFARKLLRILRVIFLHSWVNILLVFVPVGFAVHFANIDPNIVFAMNAIAIIPLAGLLTFATECVAHRLGPTLGALMNVSFGNAVELIIFIIALVKNEIRIVQASIVGSILANLLLILGMAFLLGGLIYQEQVYDSVVTQMSACLLALAILSLVIPTAFHASFNAQSQAQADANVLPISRGTSIILLIVYVLYLLFQLKSHAYMYQGTPQATIDQYAEPGILQRLDSTSTENSGTSTSLSLSTNSTGGSPSNRRRMKKKIRAKLGRKRKTKTEEEIVEETENEKSSAPQSSKDAPNNGKIAEKRADITNAQTEPVVSPTSPTLSNPAANTATTRPSNPPRGLTIRPPPVFRGNTNAQDLPTQYHYQTPASQLRRLYSTPNMVQNSLSKQHSTPIGHELQPRTNTGTSQIEKPAEASEDPPIGQTPAIILLLASTALVALCAEFLVGSINHLVENSPLSEAFVGLIILPIVGNAAEHVTAVTVAAKNKVDLCLGVSLGSSIQIALFVTPLVIIIGWGLDKDMSLYFTLFETVALFVSVFIVNFLVLDGRSNYLEGALLCACYIIIALGSFYYPDDQQTSAAAGGPSSS